MIEADDAKGEVELKCNFVPEASGDPMGRPGAGLVPQTCPNGSKGARLLYPSY